MVNHNQQKRDNFDFPQFHWLFRDVYLPPVDDNGDPVPLTEYVKTNVLLSNASSKTKTQGVFSALFDLFPAFSCHMLPIPSDKRDVIRKITENESKLSTAFNEDVGQLRQDLLNTIEPKKLITNGDKKQYMNGSLLCQFLDVCLSSMDKPNVIPDLSCGWLAAMKNRLEILLTKLVQEYHVELSRALQKGAIEESIPANFERNPNPYEDSLSPISESVNPHIETDVIQTNVPVVRSESPAVSVCSSTRSSLQRRRSIRSQSSIMTPIQVTAPRTLIGIHQSILDSKLKQFRQEINRCMGAVPEEEKADLLLRLEREIVQYDRSQDGICSSRVVGGLLHIHIQENYKMSKERCEQTFDQVVDPLKGNLTRAVDSIRESYYTMAVGPAKDDVFAAKMREFEELTSRFSPGPPRNLRVVGLANNKIKMKWSRPNVHPRAVKSYEIQIMLPVKQQARSNWKTIVSSTNKRAIIVTDLTPSSTYLFRVRAKNTDQIGEWGGEIEVTTRMGKAGRIGASAAGFVGGSVTAPFTLTAETFKGGIQVYRESESTAEKIQAGIGVAVGSLMVPIILLSETLLLTTTTGCDVAESVYKNTGTTSDDDFDENKAGVVSVTSVTSEISISTSSSTSGYVSDFNDQSRSYTPHPRPIATTSTTNTEEQVAQQLELGESHNLEGLMRTPTESETTPTSETTCTHNVPDTSTHGHAPDTSTQNTVGSGGQCAHYKLNVGGDDEPDTASVSADMNVESDSVTKHRPTSLNTHGTADCCDQLPARSISSDSNPEESLKIKKLVNQRLAIESPTSNDNSLQLGVLHSFAFTDQDT